MSLKVDPHSPIPFYYQIREQLRHLILSGQLNPGDILPTEMEICNFCGVSRMTAQQALTQLSNEGLITRQRGRGTFVAAPKVTLESSLFPLMSYTEILGQVGMQAGTMVLAQVVELASGDVAEKNKSRSCHPSNTDFQKAPDERGNHVFGDLFLSTRSLS